jgi:hypothetical protein
MVPPAPALFNRMSRPPKAHLVAEAGLQGRALVGLQVRGHHLGALGHEQLHRAKADAGAAAGDQGDLARKSSAHNVSTPFVLFAYSAAMRP